MSKLQKKKKNNHIAGCGYTVPIFSQECFFFFCFCFVFCLADQSANASKPCEHVLVLIKYLLNSLFTLCNLLLAVRTSMDTVDPDPTQPEWSAAVIVTPPKNVTAEIGDNVTLTCTAKGNPKPTIRYQKNFLPQYILCCLYSCNYI